MRRLRKHLNSLKKGTYKTKCFFSLAYYSGAYIIVASTLTKYIYSEFFEESIKDGNHEVCRQIVRGYFGFYG